MIKIIKAPTAQVRRCAGWSCYLSVGDLGVGVYFVAAGLPARALSSAY